MSEKKILVVDDDEGILSLMKQIFTRAGYNVVLAENAEKALEILERENIYVFFLNINLPGMNGLELCREIRKNMPMAIIHAVTGYASLFELSDSRDAGFDDYFNKPVKLSLLLKAAENAFEKHERWKKK
ncbi:MAG: response regulator [Thermodesulfobacteriota bacterium]|nr:response regulator [Thermodesulfobacteriota bacterium]